MVSGYWPQVVVEFAIVQLVFPSVGDHAVGWCYAGAMGGFHVDSISMDSTQLCSEFKVYSFVGMASFFS